MKTKEINNNTVIDKIDVHVHIGKYAGSFVNSNYEPKILDYFKKNGYKKIVFTHNSFFFNLEEGLKNTLEFILANSNFAYGYLVYNPHFIERSLNIIRDNFGKNNIVGIKMHPEDHRCFIDDEKYRPLWKIASEKKIPVLSHTWNPNVASSFQKFADAVLFEKVIMEFPGLKIILGYAGAKDYYYIEVVKMLKKLKKYHLYIDTAGDILYRGMLEKFVESAGAERILFGSDVPWMDPAFTISYIESSGFSLPVKTRIFSGNAADLFAI
ncbi:MAG: hypothetical protein FJW68_09350 [Actinobacteria bacterium]|nr:hypothetical protein [Actinomycetota bacterium]